MEKYFFQKSDEAVASGEVASNNEFATKLGVSTGSYIRSKRNYEAGKPDINFKKKVNYNKPKITIVNPKETSVKVNLGKILITAPDYKSLGEFLCGLNNK